MNLKTAKPGDKFVTVEGRCATYVRASNTFPYPHVFKIRGHCDREFTYTDSGRYLIGTTDARDIVKRLGTLGTKKPAPKPTKSISWALVWNGDLGPCRVCGESIKEVRADVARYAGDYPVNTKFRLIKKTTIEQTVATLRRNALMKHDL